MRALLVCRVSREILSYHRWRNFGLRPKQLAFSICNSSLACVTAYRRAHESNRNPMDVAAEIKYYLLGSFHGPGVKSLINVRHKPSTENHPLTWQPVNYRATKYKETALPSRHMVFQPDTHKTYIKQNVCFTKASKLHLLHTWNNNTTPAKDTLSARKKAKNFFFSWSF